MNYRVWAALGLIITGTAVAQVPRRVIAERFTNTLCSFCASRNPGLMANIQAHPEVLQIGYHPSSPYSSCVFSQHQVADNNGRTQYYGVFGSTPRLVIQGVAQPSSVNFANAALFSSVSGQTSPVDVRLTAVWTHPDTLTVRVVVQTVASHTLPTQRLFVGLAEDTVFYSAPNGENLHTHVFRKALTSTQGLSVSVPAMTNDSLVFSYKQVRHPAWVPSRIFGYAILQNENTKAVTQASVDQRYQMVTGFKGSEQELPSVYVFPNPTVDKVRIQTEKEHPSAVVTLIDVSGKELRSYTCPKLECELDVRTLGPGMYVVRWQTDQSLLTFPLIKQNHE